MISGGFVEVDKSLKIPRRLKNRIRQHFDGRREEEKAVFLVDRLTNVDGATSRWMKESFAPVGGIVGVTFLIVGNRGVTTELVGGVASGKFTDVVGGIVECGVGDMVDGVVCDVVLDIENIAGGLVRGGARAGNCADVGGIVKGVCDGVFIGVFEGICGVYVSSATIQR